MGIFSASNVFEVLAGVCINLTSAWLGALVIIPGLFNVASFESYQRILTANLPFGIVGLLASIWLVDRRRKNDER